jgi:hypothetical protein
VPLTWLIDERIPFKTTSRASAVEVAWRIAGRTSKATPGRVVVCRCKRDKMSSSAEEYLKWRKGREGREGGQERKERASNRESERPIEREREREDRGQEEG